MRIFGVSGTFYPFTNGHLWLIKKALSLCDKLIIFVADNPSKNASPSVQNRQRVIDQVLKDENLTDRVQTVPVQGRFLVDIAPSYGVQEFVRGIRTGQDFEHEYNIHNANVSVLDGISTIFLSAPESTGVSRLSSSYVRSYMNCVGWHWTIKDFLPHAAYVEYTLRWLKSRWNNDFEGTPLITEFDTIVQAYTQQTRRYHTLDHIIHGLSEIDALSDLTGEQKIILARAWWYHDFIQDHRPDDEQRSAESLFHHGLVAEGNLVLCTAHFLGNSIEHPLKPYMVTIDLAILGQRAKVYDQYAHDTRLEYPEYDDDAYRQGRKSVLEQFIKKAEAGILFPLSSLDRLYRERAISNMRREVEVLDKYLPLN